MWQMTKMGILYEKSKGKQGNFIIDLMKKMRKK